MRRSGAKKEYVLGIDGGATKSVAALADMNGKIVVLKRGESINIHSIGEARTRKHLKELLSSFIRKYPVRGAVFGLAGLNTKKDETVYRNLIKKILPSRVRFAVYNDTKIALEATCGGAGARILIVSGTGSNVYGEYRGKQVRAGGWDFLLGDEGSAYEFGMKAIRAAIRSYDGRGRKTILENLVLKKAGVSTIPVLIDTIYAIWHKRPNELKYYIASFSSLVDTAFAKGDPLAAAIQKDAAEELFLGARAVIKKLHMGKTRVCVGYAGSNFKAPLLKSLLTRKIKKIAPRAYFVSTIKPVEGAVLLALKLLGAGR